jgi:hypothetical protein
MEVFVKETALPAQRLFPTVKEGLPEQYCACDLRLMVMKTIKSSKLLLILLVFVLKLKKIPFLDCIESCLIIAVQNLNKVKQTSALI